MTWGATYDNGVDRVTMHVSVGNTMGRSAQSYLGQGMRVYIHVNDVVLLNMKIFTKFPHINNSHRMRLSAH